MMCGWYDHVCAEGGARWCASSHALGLGSKCRAHPRLRLRSADD